MAQSIDDGMLEFPVLLTSTGNYGLEWNASVDQAWMSIKPAVGTVESDDHELVLEVEPSGLASGEYPGKLTIYAPGATNNPVVVNVMLLRTVDEEEGAQGCECAMAKQGTGRGFAVVGALLLVLIVARQRAGRGGTKTG